MTDSRALWELVEKFRQMSRDDEAVIGGYVDETEMYTWICADELAAILERTVVVSDEDVARAVSLARTFLINWKVSHVRPSVEQLDTLADALESLSAVKVPDVSACPSCNGVGVFAEDGSGPYDCYQCGLKSAPSSISVTELHKNELHAVYEGVQDAVVAAMLAYGERLDDALHTEDLRDVEASAQRLGLIAFKRSLAGELSAHRGEATCKDHLQVGAEIGEDARDAALREALMTHIPRITENKIEAVIRRTRALCAQRGETSHD